MSSQPLVSVVIPAYNAQKTLERTLTSVLSQSWPAMEVILVDDGSKDQTLAIARRFEAADPRLTVVTQANGGVSVARNRGVSLSTGKYIRFVDADDTLPPESMEHMVLRAEKDHVDLVIGGFTQYTGKLSQVRNLEDREDTVTVDDLLPRLVSKSNTFFYGVLWNKLFSRELIRRSGAHFASGLSYGEDFAFFTDCLHLAKTVGFMRESLYDYRRQPNSLTYRQFFSIFTRPIYNLNTKLTLYRHLKDLFIARGQYGKYSRRLWLYLFRAGISQ